MLLCVQLFLFYRVIYGLFVSELIAVFFAPIFPVISNFKSSIYRFFILKKRYWKIRPTPGILWKICSFFLPYFCFVI
jgi:hypothetical protein